MVSTANVKCCRCCSPLLRVTSGLDGCCGESSQLLPLAACTSAAPAARSMVCVADRCRCRTCKMMGPALRLPEGLWQARCAHAALLKAPVQCSTDQQEGRTDIGTWPTLNVSCDSRPDCSCGIAGCGVAAPGAPLAIRSPPAAGRLTLCRRGVEALDAGEKVLYPSLSRTLLHSSSSLHQALILSRVLLLHTFSTLSIFRCKSA